MIDPDASETVSRYFDEVIRKDSPRPEVANDWARQRASALEFCRRFAEGSDTQMLGDQVGMGKTYTAMAVIACAVLGGVDAQHASSTRRALLITPPSPVLRSKWDREVRTFSATYVDGSAGTLRPLRLRNYWELVANLHDHQNTKVHRITEKLFACICHSLWQWAVQKEWVKNKNSKWAEIEDFDMQSDEALKFASSFSIPAWYAYLESWNATNNDALRRLLVPRGAMSRGEAEARATLKRLFKDFAEKQDHFEPNVFILGMNSIKRARSHGVESQRFAAFVVAQLLKGAHTKTCQAVLKAVKRSKLVSSDLKLNVLVRLSALDLYNTRTCIRRVIESADWAAKWAPIRGDIAAADEANIRRFITRFIERVVSEKIAESGIRLAVVDEVHNWKDGKLGSVDFRDHFAGAIPRKLLMSATPFQMAEDEMQKIFGFAAQTGGPTAAIIERIHGANSLVSACLAANQQFVDSLSRLAALDVRKLASADGLPATDISPWLQARALDRDASPSFAAFCDNAVRYRAAVDALLAQQRRVMIRHTRDRRHRSFHAGEDFRSEMQELRHGMYAVDGMDAPEHELVNYLAMRLTQKLQIDITRKNPDGARAHLVRGLTSGHCAFRESSVSLREGIAKLSADERAYVDMVDAAIDKTGHPKVGATVAHAVDNYRLGIKTLIFCERVATVNEIASAIRAAIASDAGPTEEQTLAERDRLMREQLFVDVVLHRSWSRASGQPLPTEEDLQGAARFALQCLRVRSVVATPRRALRLMDIWLLRRACRRHGAAAMAPAAILLAALTDDFEALLAGGSDQNETWTTLLDLRGDTDRSPVNDAHNSKTIEDAVRALSGQALNLWQEDGEPPNEALSFDKAFWALLSDEAARFSIAGAADASGRTTFLSIVLTLQGGIRRVALRPDVLRRALIAAAGNDLPRALHALVRRGERGQSPWLKIIRFLKTLRAADGTINRFDRTNTARRSLWLGADLDDDAIVAVLEGKVDPQRRVTLCAAFNSPLAPDVLICTSIGAEGIDLHRECGEVIHHDLSWNPAKLEQRIGRIDRVGRLGEADGGLVRVGIPFLAQGYEQFQYNRVLGRSQLFDVLLGKPDFDVFDIEEEVLAGSEESDEDAGSGTVREIDADAADAAGASLPVLPDSLAAWLQVDLALGSQYELPAQQCTN